MGSRKITFDHYILTRFNVGWKNNTRLDKNGNKVDTDLWLKKRVALFEKYCLPSVIGQTSSNFKWILMFDKRTPLDILLRYDHPNIIKGIHEDRNSFRGLINSYSDFVITSRIDNDDMYYPEFVEVVQSLFAGKETIIDVKGRQYSILNNRYYSVTNKNLSPFISLVEKNKPVLDTVLKDKHGNMDKHYPVLRTGHTLYTQVIHDTNLLNRESKVIWVA